MVRGLVVEMQDLDPFHYSLEGLCTLKMYSYEFLKRVVVEARLLISHISDILESNNDHATIYHHGL